MFLTRRVPASGTRRRARCTVEVHGHRWLGLLAVLVDEPVDQVHQGRERGGIPDLVPEWHRLHLPQGFIASEPAAEPVGKAGEQLLAAHTVGVIHQLHRRQQEKRQRILREQAAQQRGVEAEHQQQVPDQLPASD